MSKESLLVVVGVTDTMGMEAERKHKEVLSGGTVKAFDKVEHPFMIKILNNVGIEGAFLNIIKVIYKRPTAKSHSMGKN